MIPTANVHGAKTPRVTASVTPGRIVFGGIAFFLLALLMRNPDVAIVYISQGLRLCATTVIPSLFPFMVVSEWLVTGGAGEAAGRLLSPLLRPLFGLSAPGCCTAFLGAVCGFPIGARVGGAYYDRGEISRDELLHLLTFSNNPSSAFLITAVGVSLCGSRTFGILLYVSVLISAGICGILFRPRGARRAVAAGTPAPRRAPGIEAVPAAVASSVTGILQVSGFVVFFAAVTGTLGTVLTRAGFGGLWQILLPGALEMTSGVSRAAAPGGLLSVALIGLFCGWSGLSVHLQIMTICGGRGLPFRRYFLAKLLQGGLTACLCAAGVRWLFPGILNSAKEVSAGTEPIAAYGRVAVLAGNLFFLFLCLFVCTAKISKANKKGIFNKKTPQK